MTIDPKRLEAVARALAKYRGQDFDNYNPFHKRSALDTAGEWATVLDADKAWQRENATSTAARDAQREATRAWKEARASRMREDKAATEIGRSDQAAAPDWVPSPGNTVDGAAPSPERGDREKWGPQAIARWIYGAWQKDERFLLEGAPHAYFWAQLAADAVLEVLKSASPPPSPGASAPVTEADVDAVAWVIQRRNPFFRDEKELMDIHREDARVAITIIQAALAAKEKP